MSGVFIEMSMSLDGYVAGPNDSDVNPPGDGGVRSGLGPDIAAGMRTDEAGTELVIRAERPEDEAFLDRLACAVAVEGFRRRLAPTQPDSSSVLILGVAVNAKKLPFARGRRQCGYRQTRKTSCAAHRSRQRLLPSSPCHAIVGSCRIELGMCVQPAGPHCSGR